MTSTSNTTEAGRQGDLNETEINNPSVVEVPVNATQTELMAIIKDLQETQKLLMATIHEQRQPLQPRRLFNETTNDTFRREPVLGSATRTLGDDTTTPRSNVDEFVTPQRGREETVSVFPGNLVQTQTPLLTVADMEEFFNKRGQQTDLDFDLRPPYPSHIAKMNYPVGYITPSFSQYSGRGNAKLHLNKFVDNLGRHATNEDLCLREFSKSLSEKAYTWYANLRANSILSWKDMTRAFMTKFFTIEEKTTLADLGREKQKPNDDLVQFVKRFRELTLDCVEPVLEITLVALCVEGMTDDYRVYLENLGIATFTNLVEAAKKTSLSVKRKGKEVKTNNKSTLIATAEASGAVQHKKETQPYKKKETQEHQQNQNSRGGRGGRANNGGGRFNNNGGRFNNNFNRKEYVEPPPFPVPMPAVLRMLEKWILDGVVDKYKPRFEPIAEDKIHPRYCALHRKIWHPTEDCAALKWLIHDKEKAGQVVVDGQGAADVEENPYPNHDNRNTRARLYVVIGEGEEESPLVTMAETEPPYISDHLMNNKKFKNFFDSIGFTTNARRAGTIALVKLAEELGQECYVAKGEVHKFPSLTFTPDDMMVQEPHSYALYLEVEIYGLKLTRALADTGASLNMMTLDVFNGLAIPRDRLVKTKTVILGVTERGQCVEGHVTVSMMLGPYEQIVRFYVLDVPSGSWQIILGRPWICGTHAVVSPYHQCVKFWHKGKEVTVNASEDGIRHEVFIADMKERGRRGLPPMTKRSYEFARMTSVPLPDEGGVLVRQKDRNKMRRQEGGSRHDLCRREVLPNGRIIYHL